MKTRTTRALGVAFAALFVASTAAAQPSLERAKMLFAAGAKAYESGQYNAAIQAFEEANRLVPKVQIVFSIAQAHRRQYFLDKDVEHLRAAIKRYHEYVDAVKEGGRIADAAQALAELEPIAARTAGDAPSAKPAQKDPTRVMVMTQVDPASVQVDGKQVTPGMAIEVTPGKHRVTTTARGYFDDVRDVQAIESALVPVDVALREKPARLTVTGSSGAAVAIDGRPAGTTPLAAIPVAPGAHLVAVTKNGARAYSQEVDLGRDEARVIDAKLAPSAQRVWSYGLMLTGAAGILAGGAFTVASVVNQNDAQKILDRKNAGQISVSDADAYDAYRTRRDGWTTAAITSFAVGGAVAATGLVLYLFDTPVVSMPPSRYEDKPRAPAPPKPTQEPTEMGFTPLISPSFAGGAFGGRF